MEKCGKVRHPCGTAAAPKEAQGGIYAGVEPTDRGKAMRACSACAGDYEDPDRTAWTPGEPEDEESGGVAAGEPEEFLAEE